MKKKKEKVMVVEDDPSIRIGLEMNLEVEGYEVILAKNASEALAVSRSTEPDLVILDLVLPDGDGLDVLKDMRERDKELPVIILSAKQKLKSKVLGLKLGADDYMTKPFELPELLARIDAALRLKREQLSDTTNIMFGDVMIDPRSRVITRNEETIHLTSKELDLLLFMVRKPGRAFARSELLQKVWGYDYDGTDRTVDNFISALRQKLEPDPVRPRHFVTVRGTGYRFDL